MLEKIISMSIRWKLQFGFFMVTMITTIFNRMLASHELEKMVEITRANGVAKQVVDQLEANYSAYSSTRKPSFERCGESRGVVKHFWFDTP